MFRDTAAMLSYEAKRRPALRAMIADIATVSDTEIARARLPKWLREALLALKAERTSASTAVPSAAWLAEHIIDGRTGDPVGEMRRWVAGEHFVPLGRGSSLQVCTDALLWLPQSGGIWIETVFSGIVDGCVRPSTRSEGSISRSGYIAAFKAVTARLATPDTPVLMSQRPGSPLAAYGVRFS